MNPEDRRFAASCMGMKIGETLQALRNLPSPVIRSCHIGNNTINNWAWLALARNTHMVQFDHTLYGMDEVSAPWLLLGNGGIIDTAYDHRGREQAQYAGWHANRAIPAIDRCYLSHLNYGILVPHAGADLIYQHCECSAQLCRQMNESELGFDSSELLNARELISEVILSCAAADGLDKIFDRWIRMTRKGHIVVEPLRRIESASPGAFRFIGMNGETLFDGGLEPLLEAFFESMKAISNRLRKGTRIQPHGYPWITLCFGYLAHTLIEYRRSPDQRVFWHAGGSASSYYINSPNLSREFNEFAELLQRLGYLPQQASLLFIPTYCSQLCALDDNGLAILESMLDLWSQICRRHQPEIQQAGMWLEQTTTPRPAIELVARSIDDSESRDLRAMLLRFNETSDHKLPIAHIAERPIHPTYNKYGIAQRNLYGRRIRFAANLAHLRWAEAELLTKILALYALEQQG